MRKRELMRYKAREKQKIKEQVFALGIWNYSFIYRADYKSNWRWIWMGQVGLEFEICKATDFYTLAPTTSLAATEF